MVHGKNRIPYWIDRRLPGLAGPDYDAIISFGLPIEPEDSQYGEYRIQESPIIAYNVACITLPDCVRSIIILRGLGHRNPQYT